MRRMKWLLAAVLSLALMFAMGSTVFAGEDDEGEVEAFVDNETTLEDGEYSAEDYTFTLKKTDGTAATALTLEKIIVTDAEATGVFKVDKKTKTHLYTGALESSEDVPSLVDETSGYCGEGVYAVDTDGTLTATVPVDINDDASIAVRTYMRDSYKWVNYSYLIEMDEPDWKPTQNKEAFEGIVSSKGMVSPAAEGTYLTVNDDGTITVEATTKPMTSNRYSKIAVSLTEFDLESAEQHAENIDVVVGTAKDNYTYQGVDYGQIPYYWSMFEFDVPIEQIGSPIYVGVYNDLKKVNDDTKEYVIDEASASWQRIVTWTIINTPELIEDIRDAAEDTENQEAASRMIAEANLLEAEADIAEAKADPTNEELVKAALAAIEKLTDAQKEAIADDIAEITAIANKAAAEAAIAAAKADPTNKAKVQAALAAIDKLTDAQKAALADDIKAVNDAKTAIDKAEKEAAGQAEAAKVKAMTITLKKAKAGKKKITVSWTKNTSVEGYEVYYKTGKKAKTVKITKNSITKKVIKKLKKGKKYTVKVRGYKKVNGQMVYTKWSKAKKAKVK